MSVKSNFLRPPLSVVSVKIPYYGTCLYTLSRRQNMLIQTYDVNFSGFPEGSSGRANLRLYHRDTVPEYQKM